MVEARQTRAAAAGVSGVLVAVPFLQRRVQISERWIDFLAALLMSLAALVSAWAAYQAAWWASEQGSYTISMSRAQGQAAALSNTAVQMNAFDASMFIQYAEAVSQDNSELSEFLYQRFRPEMRTAVDAWLATRPLMNPDAPSSPLVMPEYSLSQAQEAESLRARAQLAEENARHSNDRSTQYVAFTTMAATALFLGGISSKIPTQRVRAGLLLFAWVALLVTVGYLTTYAISLDPLISTS